MSSIGALEFDRARLDVAGVKPMRVEDGKGLAGDWGMVCAA